MSQLAQRSLGTTTTHVTLRLLSQRSCIKKLHVASNADCAAPRFSRYGCISIEFWFVDTWDIVRVNCRPNLDAVWHPAGRDMDRLRVLASHFQAAPNEGNGLLCRRLHLQCTPVSAKLERYSRIRSGFVLATPIAATYSAIMIREPWSVT